MRKRTVFMVMIWVIGGLALLGLVSAGLSSWGVVVGHSLGTPLQSGKEVEYLRQSYPVSEIGLVSVDVNIAELSFIYSETDEIMIVGYGSENLSDSMRVSASQHGSTLTVNTPEPALSFSGNLNQNSYIEIALPRSYADDVRVNLSMGDLRLHEAWDFSGMELSLSMGSLTAYDALTAGRAKISVSTGNMELDSIISDDLNIDCSLGDIEINGLTGAGKISNSTGSLHLSRTALTGDLNISNSLGDIEVELIPGQSIEFSGSTSLGDIHTYFAGGSEGMDNELNATLGSGEHQLDVRNSTGEVDITEA